MKKIIFAGSIIVCAVVIIASFFMPWARAAVNVTKVAKNLSESASGKLQNTPFAGKFVKQFDRATNAAPIEPLPPALFDTTTGWPQSSERCLPTSRATGSTPAPAG